MNHDDILIYIFQLSSLVLAVAVFCRYDVLVWTVWNEWNNLDLNSVIFSIVMIGAVGMLLDAALGGVEKLVQYKE